MSIISQISAIVNQVTNKQVDIEERYTLGENGVYLSLNDDKCVDMVEKIDQELTQFFESIGVKPSMSHSPKTFNLYMVGDSSDDDDMNLMLFYYL